MFQPWEDGIKKWAEKVALEQNITISTDVVPTEFDDLHVPANFPTVTLTSPRPDQTIESYPVRFEAQANAPRGISRVTYFVDGQNVGTATGYPYTVDVSYLDLASGYHKVKVTAFDDIDNSASIEIDVNFKLPYASPQINWYSNRDNVTFYKSSFPLTINFSVTKLQDVKKLTIFYALSGSGQPTQLAEIYEVKPDQMSITWPSVAVSGAYELYGEFEEISGAKSQSNKLLINILD
jgi:hypothetical protein